MAHPRTTHRAVQEYIHRSSSLSGVKWLLSYARIASSSRCDPPSTNSANLKVEQGGVRQASEKGKPDLAYLSLLVVVLCPL
ncbi:hypothetical protein E2C01_040742 [Portunus trituberculatus]|uniref:Uncharacterized protein n=1 Tax=Portunus trituberculatus TaxID=210409 RepID=A0A5B7FQ11_PORTR|nr:hypothetical protein [Portunus trituberculatus]